MTDANDQSLQPVPDHAQCIRIADDARDPDDLIVPVAMYAAQPGDIVLLRDKKIGGYRGAGKMLLDE